jgi:hypothetical protein
MDGQVERPNERERASQTPYNSAIHQAFDTNASALDFGSVFYP